MGHSLNLVSRSLLVAEHAVYIQLIRRSHEYFSAGDRGDGELQRQSGGVAGTGLRAVVQFGRQGRGVIGAGGGRAAGVVSGIVDLPNDSVVRTVGGYRDGRAMRVKHRLTDGHWLLRNQ